MSGIPLTTTKYKFDQKALNLSVTAPESITLDDEEIFHPVTSVPDSFLKAPPEVRQFWHNYVIINFVM